jgi:glycosyltransferase involved in cell wall biosynthesis
MKILHLANHARDVGNGIVNVMIDLACAQAEAGHSVTVASAGGEFETLLREHGVTHVQLVQSKNPLHLLRTVMSYHRLLSKLAPDIVHAHMVTGVLLAWLHRWWQPTRIVSTLHNEFQKSSILMGLADRVCVVSSASATALVARGLPARRTRVILNGTIGSPRSVGRPEVVPVQLQSPNVVTVAGMYERKGIFDLTHAFAKVLREVPDARLYFVGDGPDRMRCEALTRRLGIAGSVEFTGFVSDPRAYFTHADVFVLASHTDTCPLVLSEAREAGCAIIATEAGGIPELLDFGRAGFLVPPGAPRQLAGAMTQLLKDHGQRARWRRQALMNQHILQLSRVNRDYLAIYSELLQEGVPLRMTPDHVS